MNEVGMMQQAVIVRSEIQAESSSGLPAEHVPRFFQVAYPVAAEQIARREASSMDWRAAEVLTWKNLHGHCARGEAT